MAGIREVVVSLPVVIGAVVPTAAASASQALDAGACDTEPYHQLDFWVGSWDVRLADGRQVGTNVIEKALDGCAIFEHWRDVGGAEGKSLFYYHRVQKRWKQIWVTDSGPVKEKEMVEAPPGSVRFQGALPLAEGGSILDRTTLTPLPDGRVRQLIEQSSDGGTAWRTGFEGYYRKMLP